MKRLTRICVATRSYQLCKEMIEKSIEDRLTNCAELESLTNVVYPDWSDAAQQHSESTKICEKHTI